MFDSGVKNDWQYQAQYEHGYAPNRKDKIKESGEIFQANEQTMKQDLEVAGYTNMVYPLAGVQCLCYFEDSQNKTFGFYFNGCEQFVCPFENLIDFRSTSTDMRGSPILRPNSKTPIFVTLTVNYFDRQGNPREYRLELTSNQPYLYLDVKKPELYLQATAGRLSGDLQKILSRLTGIKAAGALILAGETEVSPVDIEALQKRFAERSEKHEEANRQIRQELEEEKRIKRRGCLIWIGILVGGFILLCIVSSIVADDDSASATMWLAKAMNLFGRLTPRI